VGRHRTDRKEVIRPHEFHELADGVERALFNFESTSNHALLRLYRKSDVFVHLLDEENVILDNEHVFLVYL
jgi:hypothetical protein